MGTVIACDESGADGENLTSATHPVFAHAGVRLSRTEADRLMAEVRDRAPSQSAEFKSEQLLQPKNHAVAAWLFGTTGPLIGNASVYLVDKDYFVTAKVIDELVEEVAFAEGRDLYADRDSRRMAWTLHRDGRRALGRVRFDAMIAAFNSLMRLRQRTGDKTTVDEFFRVIDDIRLVATRRTVTEILAEVWRSRPHAEAFQERLRDSVTEPPTLDPLAPALTETVRHWADLSREEITVVHDRQAMLTEPRVNVILHWLRNPSPEFARFAPGVKVAEIVQVDSATDARVQVADLLAGAARVAATAVRNGGSHLFAELIRPFVIPRGLWSDRRSWQVLTGRDDVGL